MNQFLPIKRPLAIVIIVFVFLLLSACGGTSSSQEPVIIPSIGTESTSTAGQMNGTPCPAATSIKNVDGTAVVYLSIQQEVDAGNALVLSISAGTSQVVGLFQSQNDLNAYISHHNDAHLPLYQQQMYAGPSVLVLKQVNRNAFDLILLQGNSQGGKPNYDCRVVGNGQVNTVIPQVSTLHTELQGVQPLVLNDYKFTQPTDNNFA